MNDEAPASSRTEAVEEWIEEIAIAEGHSREEVLERLLSSHWTLTELSRLMERSVGELEPEGRGEFGTATSPSEERALSEQIATLQDTLESLQEDVDTTGDGADLDALRAEVERLAERVERLEERDERLEGRDDVAALAGRVAALEAADPGPSREEFVALVRWFRSFKASVTERGDDLEARLDEETDHLAAILAHLVESTDALEDRTASLRETRRRQRREDREARDRLVALKRVANARGVAEATCESCGVAVDLGLLAEPACPTCRVAFEDVASTTRRFGRAEHVLVAADGPLPEYR